MFLIESWLKDIPDSGVEVIFIVDNCNDKTMINLERIRTVNKYQFIKLQEGLFGGPGGARNQGIRTAEGKWIAFWDSDDVPNVKNFMAMIRNAEKRDKTIAVGSWIKCNVNRDDPANFKYNRIHYPGFVNTVLNPGIWRWAFQKNEINNCFFPEILMGEDQVFLANLNVKWSRVFRDRNAVYNYLKGYSGQLTLNGSALMDGEKMNLHFRKLSGKKENRSLYSACLIMKTIANQKLKRIIHVR